MVEFEEPELDEKESKLRSLLEDSESKDIIDKMESFELKQDNKNEFVIGLDSSYLAQMRIVDESSYDLIQQFKSFPNFRTLFPIYQDPSEKKLSDEAYLRMKTIEMWGLDAVDFIEIINRLMEHTRKILIACGIIIQIERNGNKKFAQFVENKTIPRKLGDPKTFPRGTNENIALYCIKFFNENKRPITNQELLKHTNEVILEYISTKHTSGTISNALKSGLTLIYNQGKYGLDVLKGARPKFDPKNVDISRNNIPEKPEISENNVKNIEILETIPETQENIEISSESEKKEVIDKNETPKRQIYT